MEHSAASTYGENLFYGFNIDNLTGQLVVKSWYDEIKAYNFQKAQFSPNTGHFTQTIWKGSKELGVGIAKNGKSTYVVCHYTPPGNVQGKFKDNVLAKTS